MMIPTHLLRGVRFSPPGLARPRRLLLAWALAALPLNATYGQETLTINQKRLSDRVLVTWAWDHFQGTNMAVIVTDQGLVVIDTGLSPTMVGRQREIVEAELGRNDFRYLINTHMHNDHAFANQVFPEATVLGPQAGVDGLRASLERIPELMDRLKSSRDSYGEWAAATSPDSVEGIEAREGVAAFEAGIADLERGIQPRYPTETFQGRHTLNMGDVRLELYEFQAFHSDSDILILLPEERMLFTGDVFWGGQLPRLSMEMEPGQFEQLMSHWEKILGTPGGIEVVVTGHSDVPLTVEQFRSMYLYLDRLRGDVREAKEAGTPLFRFLLEHSLPDRYPEVADFNFARGDYSLHQHNVYVLWSMTGEEFY